MEQASLQDCAQGRRKRQLWNFYMCWSPAHTFRYKGTCMRALTPERGDALHKQVPPTPLLVAAHPQPPSPSLALWHTCEQRPAALNLSRAHINFIFEGINFNLITANRTQQLPHNDMNTNQEHESGTHMDQILQQAIGTELSVIARRQCRQDGRASSRPHTPPKGTGQLFVSQPFLFVIS